MGWGLSRGAVIHRGASLTKRLNDGGSARPQREPQHPGRPSRPGTPRLLPGNPAGLILPDRGAARCPGSPLKRGGAVPPLSPAPGELLGMCWPCPPSPQCSDRARAPSCRDPGLCPLCNQVIILWHNGRIKMTQAAFSALFPSSCDIPVPGGGRSPLPRRGRAVHAAAALPPHGLVLGETLPGAPRSCGETGLRSAQMAFGTGGGLPGGVCPLPRRVMLPPPPHRHW